MNFVKTSLKYKQVTLTVLLLTFAVGLYSLFTMPRREDPKITSPIGLVVAYYPGATSAQVEERVTKKLERILFQYDEVDKSKTTSTSRDGVAVFNVTLKNEVKKPDIFWNKLRHQLLVVRQTDLPQGILGPVVNSDFGDTEAMLISIESKDATYSQLSEYARMLEDRIRTISASSKIKRLGEQQEQISVYFNPDKMAEMGFGLQQVVKVLQSQNAVYPTGELKSEQNTVSLYTSGAYSNITEIGNQVIGTSKTGQVVHLNDITTIKREAAEETSRITVNGTKAILVAVQMHEGNNIVWFGQDVKSKIEALTKELPSNVKVTTIVNQPQMVGTNVSHFMREFLIAILTVIIIVILLLPFRVAAVAATAIPMTISVTFALLHIFGIELHQVSLAALIVVLGMVVDDAIVVTDNYVELLDQGVKRWEAAWRSAYELVIPIFTATITIIASFLPMLILSGAMGEFIHDLPVTVTLALVSSFLVAMVLTPTLCFFFIKKGLHNHDTEIQRKNIKSYFLDGMQAGYDKAIDWCVAHRTLVIGGSLLLIAGAGLLFKFGVRQKFMPYAERNQFVVELWMPTGTDMKTTAQAIALIEAEIKKDKRVQSYASFIGTSAPRVYYNFSPEFPVSNYGQILVNTDSDESTESFAGELTAKIESLVPGGQPQVKLMQQGQPMPNPIEVRIIGEDISQLKTIREQVKTIIRRHNGVDKVTDDFREDYYGISIQPNEDAGRLGFTSESISQMLYASSKGYTVSSLYEADKAINIVLRADSNKRVQTTDIGNIYVQSPITGANVALRQIADIKPEWQNGRIMHRNGLRCLTIGVETNEEVLPSELLSEIQPEIDQLTLPAGYRIEYGGEKANKDEVMSQMVIALMISLLAIFLILLFQFRNLKESLIVMLTIPLSLFGAALGLVVTGNNFGLTAFMGVISLSGIVVRNAIILIDYTNELIRNGLDIRSAAIEAGKRRLRPIFLTAMAAAMGVLPMIISGSSLWSPLASVIAFGVTWSMVMSLLTVPVIYIMIIRPKDKIRHSQTTVVSVVTLLVLLLTSMGLSAQNTDTKGYDLVQLQTLALKNNHYLKIKQMQINEKGQKIGEDKLKFFPVLNVEGNYQYNTKLPQLTIPKESFGTMPLLYQLPDGSLTTVNVGLPGEDKTFVMGNHHTYNASVSFYQPLSQLPKIATAVELSKTEKIISETEKNKATMQIKQATEKLYYGLLILQKQKEEAVIKQSCAQAKLMDAENAHSAGKVLSSATAGLQAALADEEQNLLKIDIQLEDCQAELKRLTGLPDSIEPVLVSPQLDDAIVSRANDGTPDDTSNNTDLQLARLSLKKTENGLRIARQSYVPDLGIFGGYSYQHGNALYPENNQFVGVSLKWNLHDLAANTFVQKQRNWQKKQAEENVINTHEQVTADVAKAQRKIQQSAQLVEVAGKVVRYRTEDLKTQSDKQVTGLNLTTDLLNTQAALAKAEADYYAARLSYRMAITDLDVLLGKY